MAAIVGACYLLRDSRFCSGSISVRKKLEKIATRIKQQKKEKGYGFLISATKGERQAMQ